MNELQKTDLSWKRLSAEVLTIFLSITAAFAMDRWNDARKEAELERKSIAALIRDMADDSTALEETIGACTQHLDNAGHLFNLIRARKVPDDSSAILATRILNLSNFVPSSATYEMLKSSGGLSSIRDFNIRSQIIATYERYEGRALIESFNRNFIEMHVGPFLFAHINFAEIKPLEREFYNSIEFQNLVIGFISQTRQKTQYYVKCLEDCKKLKTALESYPL